MHTFVRGFGRFLVAWLLFTFVNPFLFYPDPTGAVPTIGFLLAPFGALVLVHRGYSVRRLCYFVGSVYLIFVGFALLALFWALLVGIAVSFPPVRSLPGYVLRWLLPLVVVYATAYWLAYRGGFERAKDFVTN